MIETIENHYTITIDQDQNIPFFENSSIESPMNSMISLPDPRTLFIGLIVIGDMTEDRSRAARGSYSIFHLICQFQRP